MQEMAIEDLHRVESEEEFIEMEEEVAQKDKELVEAG
jgi:hypothetical protein